jgi:hypothetical protein
MKAIRISCGAVAVAAVFGWLAAAAGAAGGMTPAGLRAYGDTYTAQANTYLAASQPQGMTPAGLRAYGDTYQSMAIAYLSAGEAKGVPVQWHDVFTGVGVTLAALLVIGAGVAGVRRSRHGPPGRPTLAH